MSESVDFKALRVFDAWFCPDGHERFFEYGEDDGPPPPCSCCGKPLELVELVERPKRDPYEGVGDPW